MSTQVNPFERSLDLWQQLGEKTMKSMLLAWESGLEQSLTFQKQVQETADRVLANQFEIASEGLKLMQQQATELYNGWSSLFRDQPAEQNGKKA